MAEDIEVTQENPSNACCAALKKKHAKLLEKYSKVEELKNKFRNCTALVQEKYDLIEKENEGLKKALVELQVQASAWKDEKEKESGVRIDLENEVSALKEEIRMLKLNDNSASQEADKQLRECLNVAQKEIKQLKDLVTKEKGRTASEKSNAEMEKKKANEALNQLEMEKKKTSEAQNVANAERKKAEEYKLSLDKLNMKIDAMKSNIALEKSKSDAAEKKLQSEKQKAIRETERADLAVAKTEEQRQIAETNLKKALFEKGRADDLNQKLEEAKNKAKKTEESHKHICSRKSASIQAGESNSGRNGELLNDVSTGMLKNDVRLSKLMEKMLLEKEHIIDREKKRADAEKKKAKKHKEVAEVHKKMAIEQKHRVDELTKELESCKLRLEEKQKKLLELVSYQAYVNNSPMGKCDIVSESDTVKLLKKQLKLEKMLVKHAKKVSKVEVARNNVLHQELFRLKQECHGFQQRLNILDKTFICGGEGMHQLAKTGNQTSETLCSDGYHSSQLISGIDSRLDPPYRGSNHKMLQSSAINSSSASFSDRPLVGSQERGTLSVTTSAKSGEDMSNLNSTISKLSDKVQIKYNEHAVAKNDKTVRSPIKDTNGRKLGNHERKRISDAVMSIEKLYSKGGKWHEKVAEKICLLHDILNVHNDDCKENLKENSYGRLVRPCKRRKTSSDERIVVCNLQKFGEPKSALDLDLDHSESCMRTSPPGSNLLKLDGRSKNGNNDMLDANQCITQDFDEMAACDFMKLLDLDNADEENAYRRAIAMPLSPILPDVEFPGDEKLQVVHPEKLVNKSSLEGFLSARDDLVSASSFCTIDMDRTDLIFNGTGSKLHKEDDSVGFLEHADSVRASNTHSHQISVSNKSFGIEEISYPGNNETNIPCEKRVTSSPGATLKYFVVSSDNRDNDSILRILHAISSYMPHLSFLNSVEIFIRSILDVLLKCEDLSMKEKVCIFFSLMLLGISEVGTENLMNVSNDVLGQSLYSAALRIHSALSEPDLKRIFMQSCHLSELLAVIDDFLLHRKVFIRADLCAGHETIPSSKINLDMNGNTMLSEMVAPAHLLVAGGSLLASLCSAFDRTDFVCEISCNIMTMQFDNAVLLAILHAFARVCGARYFSLPQYSVAMTVVKSLVVLLEKQSYSTPFSPSIAAYQSKISPCSSNCLFSQGAVPMEDVALLLLENLQNHDQSKSRPQDSLDLVNVLVPGVQSHEERTERDSGLRDTVSLSSKSHENLCAFIDTLSLVELLASFMSWEWTFNYIVDEVCEYLESHLMEGFAAAVTALLGQLGRLGVGANGYDDPRVKKLTERLSAFLCPVTFSKLTLDVQFALINALFNLTPIKFEDILEDKVEIPSAHSPSFPASFIRKWFFHLSNEQQSFLRLYQATCGSNSSVRGRCFSSN